MELLLPLQRYCALFYMKESLTDLLAYPLPVLCKEMHHTGSLCGTNLASIFC
jgi:hypothetical protein